MLRRGLAMVIGAVVVAGWMSGCAKTVAEREDRLEIPAGTRLLAVDIENFRGRVEVRADRGEAGTAVVRSEVLAPADASEGEAASAAEAVDVEAVIEERGGRGVLRIRTESARARGAERVRLYVEVPRCDGLRVVNAGGDVEVVGTAGTTSIRNRDGAIELRTSRVMDEDVELLVVDGNVYYQVPPGSSGVFDLESLDGKVSMRDFTGKATDTTSQESSLETTLGEGRNRVLARTNRGDIRVWVMEDPEALTRLIKESAPDVRDYLFLEGSRRFTRNLPDDEPRRRGTRSNPGG